MAVKIQKHKSSGAQAQVEKPTVKDQLVAEESVLTQEERALVDELLALDQQIAPIKPLVKKYEEIKKTLCAVAIEKFNSEKPAILKGEKGIAEFSAETHDREIKDKHGLIGLMKEKMGGYEALLDVLKINLGDVDKYLSEAEQQSVIGQKEEGKRTLKSVRAREE